MSHGIWGHSTEVGFNKFVIGAGLKLAKFLDKSEIKYKTLGGHYKGQNEPSYIFNSDNLPAVYEAQVLEGEESILCLGVCNARDERPAMLLYINEDGSGPKGAWDLLGLFRSVTEEYARKQDSWTFDPTSLQYYAIRNDGGLA